MSPASGSCPAAPAGRRGTSRCTPPGTSPSHLILLRNAADRAPTLEKSIEVEAAAMIAARQAGVPAPELHDHGDGALGQAYLLMERLDGETIPGGCSGTRRTPRPVPASPAASARSWPGSIRWIRRKSLGCPR